MPGLEARAIIERLLAVLDEAAEGATRPATYFVDNRPDCGLFGSLLALTPRTPRGSSRALRSPLTSIMSPSPCALRRTG